MTEDEYRVYKVKFPTGDIKGAVRVDEDGFASIYINDQLCPKAQRAAFRHEMRHVAEDDMGNEKEIIAVEKM